MCINCKIIENPIDKMQELVEAQQVALELNDVEAYRKYLLESQDYFEKATFYDFNETRFYWRLGSRDSND